MVSGSSCSIRDSQLLLDAQQRLQSIKYITHITLLHYSIFQWEIFYWEEFMVSGPVLSISDLIATPTGTSPSHLQIFAEGNLALRENSW